MDITLSDVPVGSREKHPAQKRFELLLQQITRKQSRNNKLRADMDELFKLYQTRILPVEIEQVPALEQLLERLIGFFRRKSLAQWQRQELGEWISELGEALSQLGSPQADAYWDAFQQAQADFHGLSVEEFETQRRTQQQQDKDEFEGMMSDLWGDEEADFETAAPESDTASAQADLFGFDDVEIPSKEHLHRAGQEQVESEVDFAPPADEDLFNGKWLQDLFRRAARALHPDKEQDPAKRELKQQQMSALLEARKQQDVMTLLQIYGEHVSNNSLNLAEQEMQNLCELLQRQLQHLAAQRFEITEQTPLHRQLYENLYGRGGVKGREKRLQAYLKEVRKAAKHSQELAKELRNLTVLKEALEARYDAGRLEFFDPDYF